MKEYDLYQKTHGNIIFSVYMRRHYRQDIALKNRKMMLQKNAPKGKRLHLRHHQKR